MIILQVAVAINDTFASYPAFSNECTLFKQLEVKFCNSENAKGGWESANGGRHALPLLADAVAFH